MRKANKVIADRKKNLPDKYKKVDTSVNGDVESLSKNQKGIEKHLFPLRIDQRTIIYVPKEKCNDKYADEYRIKHRLCTSDYKNNHSKKKVNVDVEKLRTFVQRGMTLDKISLEMGVSSTKVSNLIREYNLRENGNRKK